MKSDFLQREYLALQALTIVQPRIPMYKIATFVAVVLCFSQHTTELTTQQSTKALGQKIRRSIRRSDLVFLYQRCIFLVLPDTPLAGGRVVQQRLESLFCSCLFSLPVSPHYLQIRRYEMRREYESQITLSEGDDYTNLDVHPDLTTSVWTQARMRRMEEYLF
jgi:hypothetical protein